MEAPKGDDVRMVSGYLRLLLPIQQTPLDGIRTGIEQAVLDELLHHGHGDVELHPCQHLTSDGEKGGTRTKDRRAGARQRQ